MPALPGRDFPKPEVYSSIEYSLLQYVEFQVNKLDQIVGGLSEGQKSAMTRMLEEEARDLGALQDEHAGDLTVLLHRGIPIVCRTNSRILSLLTPDQKDRGAMLIAQRKEAFTRSITVRIEELWRHYEVQAGLPFGFEFTEGE